MPCLSVLFDRRVDARAVSEVLASRGVGDGLRFDVDGCRIAVAIDDTAPPAMLEEAVPHSPSPDAARIAAAHAGTVRLVTHAAMAPLAQLEALTRAAEPLLALPGALALLDEQ